MRAVEMADGNHQNTKGAGGVKGCDNSGLACGDLSLSVSY